MPQRYNYKGRQAAVLCYRNVIPRGLFLLLNYYEPAPKPLYTGKIQ